MQPELQEKEIKNVASLDLTGVSSAEELAHITKIQNVATIIVPESLMGALMRIPMENVASTIPVPAGARAKVLSGQIRMGGEGLANPEGEAADVLVISGQLIVTSPVKSVGYDQLIVSGQVLAPQGSESALSGKLSRLSGQVVYYPYTEGAELKIISGQTKIAGSALANPGGSESDALLISGQVIIMPPLEKVGYKALIVSGQLVAPKGSEAVLGRYTSDISGQMIYYHPENPRFFIGKETFSKDFFELLAEKTSLVLIGKFNFAAEMTADLLKEKVSEIALVGNLIAPRALVPVLQVLAVEKFGNIRAEEDEQG